MVFLGLVVGLVATGSALLIWLALPSIGWLALVVVAAFMLWAVLTNFGRGFGLGLVLGVVVVPIVAGGICFAVVSNMY